jgi:enoyl-CoA hydratase/carnithine racemase
MIRRETIEPGVVAVTIDNPARRNALALDDFRALAALWPELGRDESIRVVILTGAGEQAFCAGADLSGDLTSVPGFEDLVAKALLKLDLLPQPLVAAINGHCLAGGLELALAADIRIAARGAKFGLPEVKWGLIASAGGTMKLIDQIGYAAAMDLLLTGRFIDSERAQAIGLVTELCEPAEVWGLALGRAREIAAASPRAVRAAKRAALSARTARYADQEAQEREIVAKLWASGDAQVGAAAFLAKRQPQYET